MITLFSAFRFPRMVQRRLMGGEGLCPFRLPAGQVAEPSSAGQALRMALAGLGWLARADAASLPAPVQADALRGLERAASMHVAARARVLAAFSGAARVRG